MYGRNNPLVTADAAQPKFAGAFATEVMTHNDMTFFTQLFFRNVPHISQLALIAHSVRPLQRKVLRKEV